MKKLLLTLSSVAALAACQKDQTQSGVAAAGDCYQPGQVTYCGEVGTSKTYDWDSTALIGAIGANAADFSKLVADYRIIRAARVEVLPAVDEDHSSITQYTILAGYRGSVFGPAPEGEQKIVLKSSYDKRIQDDTPTIWESSGVIKLPGTGNSLGASQNLDTGDCYSQGQVASCGVVGTAKNYDWDAVSLLDAMASNGADFQKLMADGRVVYSAKVEIKAAEEANHSDVTQFTVVAGYRGSIFGGTPGGKQQLVLKRSYNKLIQDDVPMEWKSSGVVSAD